MLTLRSSRSSNRLLSRSLAWSAMSAVDFPNATFALYPNVMTRAPTTSRGRNSFSQKAFVFGCVQDSMGFPFNPCTATRLRFDVDISAHFEEDDNFKRLRTYSTTKSSSLPARGCRTVKTMLTRPSPLDHRRCPCFCCVCNRVGCCSGY